MTVTVSREFLEYGRWRRTRIVVTEKARESREHKEREEFSQFTRSWAASEASGRPSVRLAVSWPSVGRTGQKKGSRVCSQMGFMKRIDGLFFSTS